MLKFFITWQNYEALLRSHKYSLRAAFIRKIRKNFRFFSPMKVHFGENVKILFVGSEREKFLAPLKFTLFRVGWLDEMRGGNRVGLEEKGSQTKLIGKTS